MDDQKQILLAMVFVAETTGGAATTANLKPILLSWRAPVLLLLGILVVLCYIVIELAERVQAELDVRTEFEELEAQLEDFWE